jgi:hypothetical protein
MGDAPEAKRVANLEEARSEFSGACGALLALVSTRSFDAQPFREWSRESREWRNLHGERTLHVGLLNSGAGVATPRRLDGRAVKFVELHDEGATLSGVQYVPPAFLWSPEVEMRDQLRGHLARHVRSHGRRPQLHAVEELEGAVVSILPSSSGGFMLTQEAVSKSQRPSSLVLCLNKSPWRDRVVLSEGLELELGACDAGSKNGCCLTVVSISGSDRNLDRYDSNGQQRLSASRPQSARPSSARRAKSGGKGKGKGVRFSESVVMGEADRFSLSSAPDPALLDNMAVRGPSWVAEESEDGAAAEAAAAAAAERPPPPTAGARKSRGRPTLVLRYSVGGGASQTAEFSPALPDLQGLEAAAVSSSPYMGGLLGGGGLMAGRKSVNRRKNMLFTIGGDPACNVVLPGCSVRIVATVVAFENVFTLVCAHTQAESFALGRRLTTPQARFARETGVHIVLRPETSFGLYDGDTIVFRGLEPQQQSAGQATATEAAAAAAAAAAAGNASRQQHEHHDGCCSGLEMLVQLFDPTERFRAKENRTKAEALGLRWDVDMTRKSWADRLRSAAPNTLSFRSLKLAGNMRELEDVVVEVRAPVRVSQWDGSYEWFYGRTEAFLLSAAASTEEVTVGSSPLCSLSVKDPKMGRFHASVFRTQQAQVFLECSKASGKRSVLRLIAACTPPGLEAASAPPHLLLTGDVFRVGASEFRVLGFSKSSAPSADSSRVMRATLRLPRPTAGLAPKEQQQQRQQQQQQQQQQPLVPTPLDLVPTDDHFDEDELNVEEPYSGPRGPANANANAAANEVAAREEAAAMQQLQETNEARMRNMIDKRGSVALVRHTPNEDELAKRKKATKAFVFEDNVEILISNNVDKSFGLARVDEYQDVLSAFGLDDDTRKITYPDLHDFLVIQCIKGPLLRRLFLVKDGECTIGSSPQCTVEVGNDPLISPLHCRIVFNPVERHWRLIDAQSRTGTYLRITAEDAPALLQPGQRFLLGNSQLRVLGKPRETRQSRASVTAAAMRRQIRSVKVAVKRIIPSDEGGSGELPWPAKRPSGGPEDAELGDEEAEPGQPPRASKKLAAQAAGARIGDAEPVGGAGADVNGGRDRSSHGCGCLIS